jgi:hypothetical protein
MSDQVPGEGLGVLPGDLDATALAAVTEQFWLLRTRWKAHADERPSVEAAYMWKWAEMAYAAHRDVLDATLEYLVDGDDAR